MTAEPLKPCACGKVPTMLLSGCHDENGNSTVLFGNCCQQWGVPWPEDVIEDWDAWNAAPRPTAPAGDWWCPKCQAHVSGKSITFDERHQVCDTPVYVPDAAPAGWQSVVYLPKITEDMVDDWYPASSMIEEEDGQWQWTQEAVDFAALLNQHRLAAPRSSNIPVEAPNINSEHWQSVPVVPTEEMLDAACDAYVRYEGGDYWRHIYQTFLSAAPSLPAGDDDDA